MKIKKFSLEWPEELHAKFKSRCALKKRTMSNVTREIVNKWLMKQEAIKE